MNKNQAEAWVKELTGLLTDKELVSVSIDPIGVRVRTNQKFEKAYYVQHQDGSCVVALCDTYGVMTGAEHWEIDPDLRSVHAETKNGYGQPLHFVWTMTDNQNGDSWRAMRDAQERLWEAR